jgi:hypothetical protein
MRVFRTTFLGVLVVMAALLVARVFASLGFVAGSIGHTLAVTAGPLEAERLVRDALRGFQSLAHSVNPQAGYHRTISVLDVPAEIEARRKKRGTESLPGGSLVIHIDRD